MTKGYAVDSTASVLIYIMLNSIINLDLIRYQKLPMVDIFLKNVNERFELNDDFRARYCNILKFQDQP